MQWNRCFGTEANDKGSSIERAGRIPCRGGKRGSQRRPSMWAATSSTVFDLDAERRTPTARLDRKLEPRAGAAIVVIDPPPVGERVDIFSPKPPSGRSTGSGSSASSPRALRYGDDQGRCRCRAGHANRRRRRPRISQPINAHSVAARCSHRRRPVSCGAPDAQVAAHARGPDRGHVAGVGRLGELEVRRGIT